jgi:hypothetical protein
MLSTILGYIVATVLSLAAAFFGVFLILFTDVLTLQQRLLSFGYVFVLYFLWSVMLIASWPKQSRQWLWWLAIPAVAVVLFVAIREVGTIGVDLAAGACVALGIAVGHRLAHHRVRKHQSPSI